MTEPDPRVLLHAPTERDAKYSCTILGDAGIPHRVFRQVDALLDAVDDATGAIVLSEAALGSERAERIVEVLRGQPSWSDLPLVILTDGGADAPLTRRAVETMGNVTLVERPVRVATLVSVLRTSLRARTRQLQIRDHLDEVAELNAKLERLAFYDTLTGLPNRTLLRDRLMQSMSRVRRHGGACAVLFLDFDNFKVLNDSLGHDFGDRALKVVAGRLSESLRDEDTAARLGGDEFVMALSDLHGPDDAAKVARKVLESVAHPFYLDDHEVRMTTSMGIALYDGGPETPEDLLKHADLAMYHAKAEGKRTFQFFTPALHRRAMERLSLERELRVALDRKDLILHYQPRVRLDTGEVVGFEALVRWDHPTRGMISPDAFVPIAEDAGFIWELGRQVLERACRQAVAWQGDGGPPIRMSVNLSVRQLQHAGLVAAVAEVLQRTGLPPNLLELEITESATMAHVEDLLPRLKALKGLGLRLSIDDFGTGYSSLEYLQRLPIDAIKIDRGFLRQGDGSVVLEHNRAIVRAIVALGTNLGIKLVGEGVETSEQHRFLSDVGCHEGQGYLFGPPAPPEAVTGRPTRASPVGGPPGPT